jgi:hypothetical protein
MTQTVTIHLVLVGRRDRPGEYEVQEADSRAVLFGPFFASPDAAVVVESLCRRLLMAPADITVEWS